MLPGSVQWRIAGALAGFGVVLTLVAGLFSGNPFGVILLRSALGGVALGGLGVAAGWLLKRYVPELLTLGSATTARSPEAGAEQSTHQVDIVLPEENPYGSAGEQEGASDGEQDAGAERSAGGDSEELFPSESGDGASSAESSGDEAPFADEALEDADGVDAERSTRLATPASTPGLDVLDRSSLGSTGGLPSRGENDSGMQIDDPKKAAEAVRNLLRKGS
jgi:hypothetical protein